MNPLQIAAIVAQLGLGGYQMIKGNELAKTPRPTMGIQQGYLDATNLLKSQSASPFTPDYGFATNKLAGQEATSYGRILKNSPSSAATLGNIGNLDATSDSAQQDLLMKGLDRQDKNKMALAGQLNTLGGEQQKAWDWNYATPYLAAMKAANVQTTTGEKNIFGGLETGASAIGLADLQNKLNNKNPNNGAPLGWTPSGAGGAGSGNGSFDIMKLLAQVIMNNKQQPNNIQAPAGITPAYSGFNYSTDNFWNQ